MLLPWQLNLNLLVDQQLNNNEGIDLNGKTVLITGVNSGLGFESMRVTGCYIIAAARSLAKAEQVRVEVKA